MNTLILQDQKCVLPLPAEAGWTLSAPLLGGEQPEPLVFSARDGRVALCRASDPDGPALGELTARREKNTLLLSLSAVLPAGANSVSFRFAPGRAWGPALCSSLSSPWWMTPSFPTSPEKIPARTQACFVKLGERRHAMLLCLPGERFRCEMEGDVMTVTTGGASPGERLSVDGAFLSVTTAETPFAAADEGFAALRKTGTLPVPLRRERTFPEKLRGFGFCSWNAFYQNVTAEGLYAKMEEFKAAQIPVDFVVIDDGWSLLRDGKLASFVADPVKFPGGLAPCVKRLKEDYGVRFVGVWHAIHGYWGGVSPEGALYEQEKENLLVLKNGECIPAPEEAKAFAFYDHFYSRLAAEGVDFVKVDVQSGLVKGLDGVAPPSAGLREIHRGLERAAAKHFDGVVINCMGMDFESAFARPFTAVNRNSDDFFVNDPKRGFVSHAMANIYNAITDGELYYTDFDMWWSVHPEGLRSALLRALSGGPQYVSDRLRDAEKGEGGSDASLILPLLSENGRANLPFHAGRPTLDCVYTDPREEGVMKVWNEGPLGFAAAAFNCGTEPRQGELRLRDIPGTVGSYAVQDYFTGAVSVLSPEDALAFTIPPGPGHGMLWNLYPLGEDGSALLGDGKKYLGVCTPREKATLWKSR